MKNITLNQDELWLLHHCLAAEFGNNFKETWGEEGMMTEDNVNQIDHLHRSTPYYLLEANFAPKLR